LTIPGILSLNRYALLALLGWTLVIGGIWSSTVSQKREITQELAASQARAHFKKDTALRLWGTRHGRIYVEVGENYSAEPLLAHVPERDITSPSGRQLSLINPARIIRQLEEQFGEFYGVPGRITSLSPLHPMNVPDEWEREALEKFERGVKEVFEFTDVDGKPFLRLMQPMMMTEKCLLCHQGQGIDAGDVGGGVGVMLPMSELLSRQRQELSDTAFNYFLLWLLGLTGIAWGYWRLLQQTHTIRRAVSALTTSEKRKTAIMQSALDCIVTVDAEDKILEFNPAAEKTFAYSREQVIGQPMAGLLIPPALRSQHSDGFKRQISGASHSPMLGERVETTALRSDGSEFPVELAINRIDLEGDVLFTAYLRDITGSRYMAEQLTFQATHDALTGLINRQTFENRLEKVIEGSEQHSQNCLLYLDLDQFKVINDSCGHAAGDELLRQLSSQMQEIIGSRGMLARVGGDEFGALLENCDRQEAETMAKQLLNAIENHHFQWQGQVFRMGLSIGLVHIQGLSENISELFSAADAACYMAKEQGRNRVHTFRHDDQELAKRRGEMGWVQHIHKAIEENSFRLYQQKILPLDNKLADGRERFEILLRMLDEDGSLVGPDQFIGAAERYNLMPTIDRWVVSNALDWLSQSDDQRSPVGHCSINISGFSITDPQFFSFIREQLAMHNVAPEIICFEITETAAISNLVRATGFMEKVRALGCKFALDDFGSGMSSYAYLKELPVDFLKIDGEFVRDIVTDEVSLAMVKSIHEIGRVMGKQTIAEYVEDQQIMTVLKVIGIDFVQGYEIEKPKPLV